MSIQSQVMIFLMGCAMVWACAWMFFVPFVEANPQVVVPMAIGGILGFFVSVPVIARWCPEGIWDFCFIAGIAPCVGLFLGAIVGLGMGG